MEIQLSEKFGYKKLIRFTLPSVAMMIFTSLYGIVDGIFVSNVAGETAFVAVNLMWPMFMVLSAAGFMLGTGGSALVSRTLGEGDKETAKKYFSMIVFVLIIAGTIVTAGGLIFIRPLVILLGAEGALVEECVKYGTILFISFTPFMLQNAFQSFFVVAERPKLGLALSLISGFINIILDFLLIYVFKLGVVGAAAATAVSQIVGGIIPLIYFMKKNSTSLQVVATKIKLKPILKSCFNGSSEMLTTMATSLINMLFNVQLLKFYGENGVAAFGVIMYTSFIFSGAFLGYSIGVAPIIGYHFGAGNYGELKSVLKKSLIITAIASLVLTGIAEVAARPLAMIFVSYNEELLKLTVFALRVFLLSFMFMGFNIFSSAFFTALNNGLVSAIISFLRTLVFQVSMLYLLPYLFGRDAIWASVFAAEFLAIIVTVICFIVERKKYKY